VSRRWISVVIATMWLWAGVADAQGASVKDQVPDVETVGTAQRRVAPDRATVMLFVESRAQTAAGAASANAKAVQAVLDTLRVARLDSGAATASYNVGPHYQPGPGRGEPQQSGYAARTVLRVQLTRLDLVGRVIDAGLGKAATGVESIWFESSRAEETRRSALSDAAEAARRDAEALARALGGSLGPLLSTSTAGSYDPRRINVSMGEVAMARGTNITPSEIVISAAVVTRWQFVPSGRD
jgi:uncharacterized protein